MGDVIVANVRRFSRTHIGVDRNMAQRAHIGRTRPKKFHVEIGSSESGTDRQWRCARCPKQAQNDKIQFETIANQGDSRFYRADPYDGSIDCTQFHLAFALASTVA